MRGKKQTTEPNRGTSAKLSIPAKLKREHAAATVAAVVHNVSFGEEESEEFTPKRTESASVEQPVPPCKVSIHVLRRSTSGTLADLCLPLLSKTMLLP